MKPREIPVCGLAAVQALYLKNPDAIKRLFFDQPTSRQAAKISSYLAKTRKVYRLVVPAELEKIASTIHHGGIVAIIEQKALKEPSAADIAQWAKVKAPLILLDRIGNAHNLGALVRTGAFFGVDKFIMPDHPQQALPGEAAHRVAEGGLEHVELLQVKDLARFCQALRTAGYDVVGASAHGGRPSLAGKTGPVAVVLGNEEHGLSKEVEKACSRLVTLPGSGKVESLNVSVAGAVLMWELFARNR